MDQEHQERIRYLRLRGLRGLLLALNLTGVFKTFLGIDTAVFITLLAGHKTFYNFLSALLEGNPG